MVALAPGMSAAAPDNYSAPFGNVGAASPVAPTVPPPTITADVINQVPPTVPVPPSVTPTPPPVAPPPPIMPNLNDEINKSGRKICEAMMPYVLEGYYDFVATFGINNGTVMVFVNNASGNSPGLDHATVKSCHGYGHTPTEIPGHSCATCNALNPTVPDGFYAAHTTGYDMDGNPVYDFSTVTPLFLRFCLNYGQRPAEVSWGYGGSCTDPYYGP
jgi:hypothetical protein